MLRFNNCRRKQIGNDLNLLAQGAQFVRPAMEFSGFSGKPAGYFYLLRLRSSLSWWLDCIKLFELAEIQTYRTGIIFHTQGIYK